MYSSGSRKKVLSVFGLAMINVIAIDSLRNLPINAEYGLSIIAFYIIGTLLFFIPCILVTAEMATHIPQTGGSYVWVRKAFGPRIAFMNTWLQWIYNVVWFPTILSFIAASVSYLIDPNLVNNKKFMLSMIIGMFLLATFVNCLGMRLASWISTFGALIGTIIPMALIIVLGACWISMGKPTAINFNHATLFPKITHINDLAFLVVIFFSLIGIEMSAVHAGDVKNPATDYPRALWISGLFIVISMILSSVAVAIILPRSSINIVSGLNQAFDQFLTNFGLHAWMPVAVLTIIIGGFAGMAAWVLGPTKALMVAAKDGCAPEFFTKTNRFGSPVGVLIAQAVIVIILCGIFLLFKTVSASYWVLSDLTAQLALIYYILLFASAIKLRSITDKVTGAFRIPGGKLGIIIVCVVGITTCLVAIALGFLPPTDVKIDNTVTYELSLAIGIIIFTIAPLIIFQLSKNIKKLDAM
ncbi:MAG: APC family permease [Coxiellaceae bacterium]|nr:APC family permease [Coxiellaceae bacterium]